MEYDGIFLGQTLGEVGEEDRNLDALVSGQSSSYGPMDVMCSATQDSCWVPGRHF